MRAAQQPPSNPPDALPKNPFADSQSDKPAETTITSEVANPTAVSPEAQKSASAAPAATANGDTVVNGTAKTSTLDPAPAVDKPASPALGASATNDASDALGSSATAVQPPVMTGALPLGDKPEDITPKPTESTETDGVKDITPGTAASEPIALNGDDRKEPKVEGTTSPSTAPISTGASTGVETGEKNGADTQNAATSVHAPTAVPSAVPATTELGEEKDVEMEDATPLTAPAPTTKPSTTEATEPSEKGDVEMQNAAPTASSAEPVVPEPAAPTTSAETKDNVGDATPATGVAGTPITAEAAQSAVPTPMTGSKKRKAADEAGVNGADASAEPTAKKQKGAFARAVAKAKETVHDVKEKATSKRKGSKKEKERPAVGRTERKTRSQGRAD